LELIEIKAIKASLIIFFFNFRSKWYTDEHFRGSYSFQSMVSEQMDVKPRDLAEPIMIGNKPVCNPKIKIT